MTITGAFPHGLQLHGTTDLDVAKAIASDTPFPERPGGAIELGHVAFSTPDDAPLSLAGGSVPVTAKFSAGVAASAGIFPDAAAALASLGLEDTARFTLDVPQTPTDRYALLASSYTAKASVDATHPIGAVGSLSIGASAASTGLTAVLHRFDRGDGAAAALKSTIASWALPRSVKTARDMPPGTWLIADADGSLAVKVVAAVGYNMDFIRYVNSGAFVGDIGLKVDAAVKATFAIEVSGRYLVVVGREAAEERVRVRLFKLGRKGLNFGLNLKIGVAGVLTAAPDKVTDFVCAMFGLHGTQIAAALSHLDEWTSPDKSVGEVVAGLTNEKALALLADLTGKDPRQQFDAARGMVVRAIDQWETLGPRVSEELWRLLGTLNAADAAILKDSLQLLASSGDPQRQAFTDLLSDSNFISSPLARLLDAAADHGLLSLVERLPEVRSIAATILDVVNGGVIGRLQRYVEEELKLEHVLAAVKKNDFDTLDAWLVGRLGVFFDKQLRFEDLEEVKGAIHLALSRQQQIYDSVTKALTSRYGFDLAQTWQQTTTNTAVFDVVFDTTTAEGEALLASLLQRSDVDTLLTTRSPAVKIRAGVLTHEATRKTTVHVSLPHVDLQTETVNSALASVQVDASGPGLLAYRATGKDVVDAKNRFRSSLSVSVAAAVAAAPGGSRELRIHSLDGTWSYELLHAAPRMRREELESMTRPFITEFMAAQFTGATNLSGFYRQLDDSIEARLHNGPDTFGDVCSTFEVTLPAAALRAWFRPAANVTAASKALSIAIQKALKEIVPFYYLADVRRLHTLGPSAALLTWASIAPSTGSGGSMIWDSRDPEQLNAMLPAAAAALAEQLAALRLRLEEAGMHDDVQFYAKEQAPAIVQTALGAGRPLLDNLLSFERAIVVEACNAFTNVQRFIGEATPSKALDRLADFAGDITEAFNTLQGHTVFVGPAFRPVSQALFAEAARALDPAAAPRRRAMLTIAVLKPERKFDIATFPSGSIPEADEVVVGQRLVAL